MELCPTSNRLKLSQVEMDDRPAGEEQRKRRRVAGGRRQTKSGNELILFLLIYILRRTFTGDDWV